MIENLTFEDALFLMKRGYKAKRSATVWLIINENQILRGDNHNWFPLTMMDIMSDDWMVKK